MASKQKQKTNIFSTSTIVSLLLGLVAVAAIVFGVMMAINSNHSEEPAKEEPTNNTTTSQTTEETPTFVIPEDDTKARMEEDEQAKAATEKNDAGLKIAEPMINFITLEDDYVVVGGDIPNINEAEGSCTFEFTKGSEVITTTTGILPNPTYISCETARLERSRFSSGIWSVKIKYKSTLSEGESETQTWTAQ